MKGKDLNGSVDRRSESISRHEFLRAVGAAGLGMAGLGAALSAPTSAEEAKKRYIVVITYGGDNPNRAVWALLMAETILKKGWGPVHVWLTMQGADLCRKGVPEKIISPIFYKFGNAGEILAKVRKAGATFGVCPPCAEYFGAADSEKADWVELQGGDWLMKSIQEAWVVWM